MSLPPALLLLQAKLDDVDAAFATLQMVQARQLMISANHRPIYSQAEHAQLVAINLQGISELLAFRHVVRSRYTSELRAPMSSGTWALPTCCCRR